MHAVIQAIEYYLPADVLTNAELARQFPAWSEEKILAKTGVSERRLAHAEECASDLAAAAARKLFAQGACRPEDVDFLLLCTQSPDYFLPTTACLLQERLGIPTTAGALDFNLGCSGYVYGLALAKGLIESQQARCVLLLTAETYSKFVSPQDHSVRTLFGDAAAATLVGATATRPAGEGVWLGPFTFGTDGSGGKNLIVQDGAFRSRAGRDAAGTTPRLSMNGPEIFNFTLRVVPASVRDLLARAERTLDEIDLFVFHQANTYMLDHLRRKIGVSEEKFYVAMGHCGNTVSSTIPIALSHARAAGRLAPGKLLMLVGFGVGYSWGGALLRWGGARESLPTAEQRLRAAARCQ
jgi:3-oxoacyl-[acyl-carrier-protein] synthase-3